MGAPAEKRHAYTYRDYLELEALSNVRHEYDAGEIYAMAGGTPDHAALCLAVGASLLVQLRGKPCRAYGSELRVRVLSTGLTTYPDASVVCGALAPDPESAVTATNPTVIVEVLSPSTEAYDRGEKREHYQQIASVREIVLVAYDQRRVEIFRRTASGFAREECGSGEVIELPSIGCVLDVDALYDDARVAFGNDRR
jgi:Uma2 family endonuclease